MAGAGQAVGVGDSISTENGRWTFDGSVSQTFDSHVEKSVPLYREGHDLIAKLSDFSFRMIRSAMSSVAPQEN